jgi:hypothetical protein
MMLPMNAVSQVVVESFEALAMLVCFSFYAAACAAAACL